MTESGIVWLLAAAVVALLLAAMYLARLSGRSRLPVEVRTRAADPREAGMADASRPA